MLFFCYIGEHGTDPLQELSANHHPRKPWKSFSWSVAQIQRRSAFRRSLRHMQGIKEFRSMSYVSFWYDQFKKSFGQRDLALCGSGGVKNKTLILKALFKQILFKGCLQENLATKILLNCSLFHTLSRGRSQSKRMLLIFVKASVCSPGSVRIVMQVCSAW